VSGNFYKKDEFADAVLKGYLMLKLATKLVPRSDALETAYRAGYRYVELWLDQRLLLNWQTIYQLASAYPFSYALHFPNQLNLESESLEHIGSLYRKLGCRSLVIHQPMFDKFQESLLHIEPELRLAVENHKLAVADFANWATRNAWLTLDIEHLWKFTLRDSTLEVLLDHLQEFLTRYGDKLAHVHLPGYWPGFQEHRPMYCARDMIFPALSLLAETRFEGFVVSEVDADYQNRAELRMDSLLFEAWREQQQGR
jgi:sugar phosphate isomerase/epimerase